MALPVSTASVETLGDFDSPAKRWKMEIKIAQKAADKWMKRGKKIVRRYADERTGTTEESAKRFNILWSNVQTLKPAIYARAPKPVVERRYMDRDPVARVASMILERAIGYELKTGNFHDATDQAVQDLLLPGRGTVWIRYEPKFSQSEDKLTNPPAIGGGAEDEAEGGDDGTESSSDDDGSDPQDNTSDSEAADGDNDADADVEVLTEKLCLDYVHWTDFLNSPARVWEEVKWVAKKAYLTRDELTDKFGDQIGNAVPLDHSPPDMDRDDANAPGMEAFKKAGVWEIWDKTTRKVFFLSEQYEGDVLGEHDDPLKLDCFWPCPKPLFATLTNDNLNPIPDYAEYQDQAEILDELTARINKLQEAIKAIGVYDASVPELRRIFEEGEENKVYPVDSWAAFAEKGGVAGAISLMPIKELAEVLMQLYEAREKAKQDLYEVTGIADIVRGQSKSSETATAQQIKSNFATLRLDSKKTEVARFCRDTVCIMGEMIAEHFSPKTLYEISGFESYAKDQFQPQPQQAPQAPQMGHNGGPPMDGAPQPQPMGMMAPAPPQPSPQMVAAQMAAQQFEAAIALLKNEKQRGFAIDIETDSTVEPDRMQEKKDRTEFITQATQFIAQAEQIAMMDPTIVPVLGKMLLFGIRAFPTARDLETTFEEWITKAEQKASQPRPPQPNPDMIKAQAEMQRMQGEMEMAKMQFAMDQQTTQAKMAADAQSAEHDLQVKRQIAEIDLQIKMVDLQIKQQELGLKQQSAQIDAAMGQQKMALDEKRMGMEAERSTQEHELGMESDQAKHDMGLEMMAEKAKQAKQKPNEGARA